MSFKSLKCGEIFCIAPAVFNVTCSLCGDKIHFNAFLRHYQQLHFHPNPDDLGRKRKEKLKKDAICYKDDDIAIKEEAPEEDPFKQEDYADDDDTCLQQFINEKEKKTGNCKKNPLNESLIPVISQPEENEYDYADMMEAADSLSNDETWNNEDEENDDDSEWNMIENKQKRKAKTKNVETEEDEPQHSCQFCGRKYRLKGSMFKHIQRQHKDLAQSKRKINFNHECDRCDARFRTARALETHLRRHDITGDVGDESFSQVDDGGMMEASEILSNDENETFNNEDDEIDDDNELNMTEDIKEQTAEPENVEHEEDEPQHSCQFCGRKYRLKGSMLKHINRQHKDLAQSKRKIKYNHEWDKCDAKFPTSRAHLRRHGTTCESGGKSLTQVENVVMAEAADNLSNDENEIRNNEDDENEIWNNEDDENEMWNNADDENDEHSEWNMTDNNKEQTFETENVEDELQHICPFCGRKYRIKGSMFKHIQRQHKDLAQSKRKINFNHECDRCDAKFRTARALETHLRRHDITGDVGDESFSQVDDGGMMEASEVLSNDENETWNKEDDENDDDKEWNMPENKKEQMDETENIEDELQHSCPFCEHKYRIKGSLSKHIHRQHRDLVKSKKKINYYHECDKCDAKFRIARALESHLITRHGIKCDVDGKSLTQFDNSDMMESAESLINDENEKLNNEDEENGDDDDSDWNMSENKKEQTADTENVEDELQHSCPFCGLKYRLKGSMLKHIQRLHRDMVKSKRIDTYRHECDKCDGKFRTARALQSHQIIHNGIACNICGKSFSQLAHLRYHKVRHGNKKEHKCKECPMEFFTAKELRSHMRCHTGITPAICEICGKAVREKGRLLAHMRRHTGERPAKCDECGKSFFSFHDLNVHKVTHTDLRPFKCDICNSTFQTKKAVRKHSLIHAKDRNHVCCICGKGFHLANGLKNHMRSHDAAYSTTVALETPSTELSTTYIAAGTEIIFNVDGVQILGQYVV